MVRREAGTGRIPGTYQQASRVLVLLDRLVAGHEPLALASLASELGVSERQVRRDLIALELAGYPVLPARRDGRAAAVLEPGARARATKTLRALGPLGTASDEGVARGTTPPTLILGELQAAVAHGQLVRLRYRRGGSQVIAAAALLFDRRGLQVAGWLVPAAQTRASRPLSTPRGRLELIPLRRVAVAERLIGTRIGWTAEVQVHAEVEPE